MDADDFAAPEVRVQVRVRGLVQGVGFRPFVWRVAHELRLSGWVSNDDRGVLLEAQGTPAAVRALLAALRRPPPLAKVDQLDVEPLEPEPTPPATFESAVATAASSSAERRDTASAGRFVVRESSSTGVARTLVAPDTAPCDACSRELADPTDRRYRHPFLSCTDCGPRFTLVEQLPYDRERTTMGRFPLCADCAREYADPADRRFHAEPVCCLSCGPRLTLLDASGRPTDPDPDPVTAVAQLLRRGAVVAVKGLGGYHLAVDATDPDAVQRLRTRKHRPHRPFALLLADLAAVERLCRPEPLHRALLISPARPVVVVPRRTGAAVADAVAPDGGPLGVMLPYTPLHTLLARACDRPLVFTSANAAGEPLVIEDDEALGRLAGVADAFLVHDRRIAARADDSVVAVAGTGRAARPVPLRRSRGRVPSPILLRQAAPVPVLACGAALKNTFCLVRADQAFVSAHVGDLSDLRTQHAYGQAVEHLQRIVGVEPDVLAHDLHPDYPSTAYALQRPAVRRVAVQHHHAHIASCLADNGHAGPVLGVAFDGLGLGPSGDAWGGEFLIADLTSFTRVAHLAPVVLPGGDAAAREPWRMALAHLDAAYGDGLPAGLDVAARQQDRWRAVRSIARAGANSPATTSAGRLFDGVAALLGVRDLVSYEGQAAIELELLAEPAEQGSYPVPVTGGPPAQVEVAYLVRALVADLLAGVPAAVLAARFHHSLAEVVRDVCGRLRSEHDLSIVALSGGVFCNGLLLARTVALLEADGFTVLTHRDVPANDGGLSLGQAAVAAAVLAAER